jgi:protein-tyrosine kinase
VFRKKNKNKLAPHLIPDYMSTEQTRMIRTNLDLVLHEGPALVMVTSPDDMEQKPTISSNLAVAFAEQGKKVLLVDANIVKPSLHQLFNISDTIGLTNVIINEESLMMNTIETYIPGLHVLPIGALSINASELWVTSKLKKFAAACREEFDLVIFDVPALLTVSDPLVLANQCDGIILVVEHNKTKKEAALKTKEYLSRSNNHILGVIYQTG